MKHFYYVIFLLLFWRISPTMNRKWKWKSKAERRGIKSRRKDFCPDELGVVRETASERTRGNKCIIYVVGRLSFRIEVGGMNIHKAFVDLKPRDSGDGRGNDDSYFSIQRDHKWQKTNLLLLHVERRMRRRGKRQEKNPKANLSKC